MFRFQETSTLGFITEGKNGPTLNQISFRYAYMYINKQNKKLQWNIAATSGISWYMFDLVYSNGAAIPKNFFCFVHIIDNDFSHIFTLECSET